MNQYFENINKKLDFGCMRLPMIGDEGDYEETKKPANKKSRLN